MMTPEQQQPAAIDSRPCTCPADERPWPCPRKFALTDCKNAASKQPAAMSEGEEPTVDQMVAAMMNELDNLVKASGFLPISIVVCSVYIPMLAAAARAAGELQSRAQQDAATIKGLRERAEKLSKENCGIREAIIEILVDKMAPTRKIRELSAVIASSDRQLAEARECILQLRAALAEKEG